MAPDLPSGSPDGAPQGDLFAAGGEAGRRLATVDWAASPLGPVPTWPAALRSAVRTVLAAPLPVVLTWGPAQLQFANDLAALLLGAGHPEIDGAAGSVLATGEPVWLPRLPLPLDRTGARTEVHVTVSATPVFADDGTVAGALAACTEVTAEVLGERRERLLRQLATAGCPLGDEDDVLTALGDALAGAPLDLPFAAVYLTDGGPLRRAVTAGCPPDRLPAAAADAGELPRRVAGLGLVGGPAQDPVTEAVVLPLGPADGEGLGVLVAGVSPNRVLDAEYRAFLELVAEQLTGVLGTARAFAAERREAAALAERNQARTTFFSDVSHELRTPLSLLLGPIADLLADPGGLPATAHEQLTLALRNGRRLQRLVDDLMDVAALEAGHADAVRVETDLAAVTTELAGVLRAAAERAGLRLSVDCPPLPRPVHVDPRMWETIVLNLVSNAVKYTFVGGITVALRDADDGVLLTVADTGIGIPAAELPRVFDRFHRVPGAPARSREGTGIGLDLVRELVALHGGSATVASEPGVGSTFTISLPYGSPDAEGSAARPATPSATVRDTAEAWEADLAPRAEPAAPAGTSTTVLVVDDNADMRTYLTRLLAPIWAVRTCSDGEQALASIAEQRPDVVLTDVMMPGVDGFELLRRLRATPAGQDVPVIMLTARAGQAAAVEGFAAGADDYLAKPFQAAELIARVRVAIARAVGRRAASERPPAPRAGLPPQRASAPDVRALVPASRAPAVAPPPPPAKVFYERWRFPSAPQSVPALRRALRRLFSTAGLDEDQSYDLLLAVCEAATNAIEHAQDPIEPFVDVTAEVGGGRVVITVRDHGQWRERGPSMDRGRGSTLMSAFADVTAVPGPEGTTVTIRAPRSAD